MDKAVTPSANAALSPQMSVNMSVTIVLETTSIIFEESLKSLTPTRIILELKIDICKEDV